jgi:succinyl-CoA synthetase beta subunit
MARITSNVHTGQRGQAGKIKKQKQKARRKQKDWLGSNTGWGFQGRVVFLFLVA